MCIVSASYGFLLYRPPPKYHTVLYIPCSLLWRIVGFSITATLLLVYWASAEKIYNCIVFAVQCYGALSPTFCKEDEEEEVWAGGFEAVVQTDNAEAYTLSSPSKFGVVLAIGT